MTRLARMSNSGLLPPSAMASFPSPWSEKTSWLSTLPTVINGGQEAMCVLKMDMNDVCAVAGGWLERRSAMATVFNGDIMEMGDGAEALLLAWGFHPLAKEMGTTVDAVIDYRGMGFAG
ncbi:hypothetical protein ACLOJK_003620 [Asimina triloba]